MNLVTSRVTFSSAFVLDAEVRRDQWADDHSTLRGMIGMCENGIVIAETTRSERRMVIVRLSLQSACSTHNPSYGIKLYWGMDYRLAD